ncbi:class I SAM-dependent methyltransferase [Patulibacter defluvii]|uniref:class I SAM-dependent methyltransferase n=1 Tax=Patulibacter defluvii TaxID=3095358 RepID=UPI002A750FF3|nr:class I SAM-dependent methyltransferase [Patulibacter sp. DM4]
MPDPTTDAGPVTPASGDAPSACPACGGPLARWRNAPSGEPSLPGEVPLRRCVLCGTAVTGGPAPAFSAAHDAGSYATRRPRGAGAAAPLLAAFDRQRLRLVERHRPAGQRGRLLDVGAGRGRFVAAARAAGWDARGIEPSARGVEAARAVYDVALERAMIDDAAVAPASLDAATLWHVLEHLDDPGAALATIRDWLRPGAVLLVGVPNLGSWQARIGGRRWFHLDVPRHRVHLTPAGLRQLAEDQGLQVLAVHQVLLEHNPFGMWQSLVNRLTGTTSHLFHVLKRAERPRPLALAVTLLALPLVPLVAAVEALAGALGHGGTMALVARRPADG